MNSLKNRLLIFSALFIFSGCATNPLGYENLLTVVSGNHSEAVTHTTNWLNTHQFLVVDRWVTEDLGALYSTPETFNKQRGRMLSMAQKAGASLVVLVQVSKEPTEQENLSLNSDDPFFQNIEVEIQVMNAETATIEYSGKARDSSSLAKSDELIIKLTTLALQKAFTVPSQESPHRGTVPQEKIQGELPQFYSSLSKERTAESFPDPQLSKADSTVNPDITKALVAPEPEKQRKEEVAPFASNTDNEVVDSKLRATPSSTLEDETSSDNASIGLHVASGTLSLLYTPCKLAYAVLGGIFGGFAYVITAGNEVVAHTVWNASLQGTYWLSPEHVSGEAPIFFQGPQR